MCSKIDSNLLPAYFAAPDWIEALLQEYENEEKEEARWPTLLLHSFGRKLVWHLCTLLGVSSRGVPGNACRLLERYFARHIRAYFQVFRDNDEWQLYRSTLASRYPLLAVSCIQLAAKMIDLTAPLSASLVCSLLLKSGVVHSKTEIVHTEFHVYHTLDFRIPLWTSIEVAQFLAIHVGLSSSSVIEAVAYIVDLSEFNRDLLEHHLRCSNEVYNTPGSSSFNSSRPIIRTLHVSAGGVCASARFMRTFVDPTHALAALTRTTPSYIKTISNIILDHIIPAK